MKPNTKLYFKIVFALAIIALYKAFTGAFSVELGLDAAMQQMENVEFSYAPSAFMQSVNNYGWLAAAGIIALLFKSEILLFITKLKRKTTNIEKEATDEKNN